MMNNNNGGKRNNFRRFGNNKNKNRHHRGGPRFNTNVDDGSNINPQQRRNFDMKKNTHLAKAKELLSAGERVDAEWHMQHADHYHRMSNLGLDRQRQFDPQNPDQNPQNPQAPQDPNAQPNLAPPADDIRFISDLPPEGNSTGGTVQTPATTQQGGAGNTDRGGLAGLPFMQQ